MFNIRFLGQAGFVIEVGDMVIYIDPYLSNFVEKVEGEQAKRLVPIAVRPENILNADWVLITHSHIDHCDPETLLPIAESSPNCHFMGPWEVCENLTNMGISENRQHVALEEWYCLGGGVRVLTIPAAHPEISRDNTGRLHCVGYLLEYDGKRVYHSGDTVVDEEIIELLHNEGGVDVALLPVNEKNYYRDKLGIIGNMSIRDAFSFASDIEARILVPMHWDMFDLNSVYKEEIQLVYDKKKPNFRLEFNPESLSF